MTEMGEAGARCRRMTANNTVTKAERARGLSSTSHSSRATKASGCPSLCLVPPPPYDSNEPQAGSVQEGLAVVGSPWAGCGTTRFLLSSSSRTLWLSHLLDRAHCWLSNKSVQPVGLRTNGDARRHGRRVWRPVVGSQGRSGTQAMEIDRDIDQGDGEQNVRRKRRGFFSLALHFKKLQRGPNLRYMSLDFKNLIKVFLIN